MQTLTHSEDLKTHTREVHLQFERMLIPLIQGIATPGQYANLLKLFYAFYAPLEELLRRVDGMKNLTAGLQLRKADSLKNDIKALEPDSENFPTCDDLPTCDDVSRAMGVLYVLEGSVLGGKGIAGMITRKLPSDKSLPLSFFLYYGDEAQAMWNDFKANLESHQHLSRPAMLSAATDTFTLFKHWIHENRALLSLSAEGCTHNSR